MNKWLVLHNNSRFSQIFIKVLGANVQSVYIDDLINKVVVRAQVDHAVNHRWVVSGRILDDFHRIIIYQEVFFSVESSLYQYATKDRHYVKFSWQAYLLSLFAYSKTVINPVTPSSLSISYYQFPRLLTLAETVGFRVPRYEIGRECKPGYVAVDSLWYWPGRKNSTGAIMNVEMIEGRDHIVRFVRYDEGYIICWPSIPKLIENKLLMLCNQLGIYIGEVAFRVSSDWVFYGLRPQIQTDSCTDQVLIEIAECLRDIGNEVIV